MLLQQEHSGYFLYPKFSSFPVKDLLKRDTPNLRINMLQISKLILC